MDSGIVDEGGAAERDGDDAGHDDMDAASPPQGSDGTDVAQGSPESDAVTDGGARDAAETDDVDASPPQPSLMRWTGGHGDITFAMGLDRSLEAFVRFEGATIDGVADVDGDFALDEVLVYSTALFSRPEADGGFFAPLCVEPGDDVHWLPQSNRDATAFDAPFVGLLAEVDPGVLVDDELTLELVAVRSPSGAGAYSLWRDGFPPTFSLASCDGENGANVLELPIGHDHFNMGFGEPGYWHVDYRVTGQLVEGGARAAASVTVHYLLE